MTRGNPTPLTLRLGAKVARLRRSKEWTQKQVEEMAGFHPGYLSRVENGLLVPELEGLSVLAKVLGMNLSKLLSGIDDDR
jgi:transcriptional regulator with XRE-family HTH domain